MKNFIEIYEIVSIYCFEIYYARFSGCVVRLLMLYTCEDHLWGVCRKEGSLLCYIRLMGCEYDANAMRSRVKLFMHDSYQICRILGVDGRDTTK
jgi:hypothetical protein